MTDAPPTIELPRECTSQWASLTVYARTRAGYYELCQRVREEPGFRDGFNYVSWNDKVNGIRWMVMRPSLEQEEELDYNAYRESIDASH